MEIYTQRTLPRMNRKLLDKEPIGSGDPSLGLKTLSKQHLEANSYNATQSRAVLIKHLVHHVLKLFVFLIFILNMEDKKK